MTQLQKLPFFFRQASARQRSGNGRRGTRPPPPSAFVIEDSCWDAFVADSASSSALDCVKIGERDGFIHHRSNARKLKETGAEKEMVEKSKDAKTLHVYLSLVPRKHSEHLS